MLKNGYNPVRRNRNIGTAKQGRGKSNALTIPRVCHTERIWWENLGPHRMVKRTLGGSEITFVIEHAQEGYVHACSVDDVWHLLSMVPVPDLESLHTIVMRQSTHKQALVDPSWGRLAYAADLGKPGKRSIRSGPAVFLEAIDLTRVWKWSRELCPEDCLELDRLRSDGHTVDEAGKKLVFRSTLQSSRVTQLYRTLLHEVGHWVDWLEKVERPAEDDFDLYDVLSNRYFARPAQERESFAHQYADTLRNRLTEEGKIPFDPIIDDSSVSAGFR